MKSSNRYTRTSLSILPILIVFSCFAGQASDTSKSPTPQSPRSCRSASLSQETWSEMFWRTETVVVSEGLQRMHFRFASSLLDPRYDYAFMQVLRDIDLFSDPTQFFLKLDLLKKFYLNQHNQENPHNLILMGELLSPGLVTESVQDGALDFVTFLGREPVEYGHNIPEPDIEYLVYSEKYLYPALSAGVFPVVLHNPNILFHDLLAHSLGHALNPRYARVYRQMSRWVRDTSYRNLTQLQKQILFWFNEYYFFIPRQKIVDRQDIFPILDSDRIAKVGSLGYSTRQIKRFLIETTNREEALELSQKLVSFVLEHLKPAGGVVSELVPQFSPKPLQDLIYFLNSREDFQEPMRTEEIFDHLAAAQSSVFMYGEFSPEEVLKLIKKESSILKATDFQVFRGSHTY